MEIGKKIKAARIKSGLTQEEVAEKIEVSRQTISNWENEKSYPDILNVIKLSDVYQISLDELVKGDEEMVRYLEESTNVVRSNQKLLVAVSLNMLVLIFLMVFNSYLSDHSMVMVGLFCFVIISSSVLFYQIIRKF